MKFLKSLYSIKDATEVLNDYFSVSSFRREDVVNMFFEGSIDFSVRCTFTNFEGIFIDDKQIDCEISVHGVEHSGSATFCDGYAEIKSLCVDGEKGVVGGGLFNINRELANKTKEGAVEYILAEELEFIECANVETYPQNIDCNCITLSFLYKYSDQIPIKLSSILITQKSLLECIVIIEQRASGAKSFLELGIGRNELDHTYDLIKKNEAQANRISELEQQLEELKQKLEQSKQLPPMEEVKQNRISQPQRDIFTLLVMNNYQNYQSRNSLFEAINAEMKAKGIRASDIKYPTLDNLIDDNLRINKISPFPPKQK